MLALESGLFVLQHAAEQTEVHQEKPISRYALWAMLWSSFARLVTWDVQLVQLLNCQALFRGADARQEWDDIWHRHVKLAVRGVEQSLFEPSCKSQERAGEEALWLELRQLDLELVRTIRTQQSVQNRTRSGACNKDASSRCPWLFCKHCLASFLPFRRTCDICSSATRLRSLQHFCRLSHHCCRCCCSHGCSRDYDGLWR